jgi:peptide/nickel transport system ATP-binding protein/oligopeptide transport system ATP-binding protein
MMGAPIVEGIGLHKRFAAGRSDILGRRRASLRAVDGVDIDVSEGEIHGLVGESGCGKSTLGRLLLGLLDCDSGTVRFMGRELAELARRDGRELRRSAQIVFQNPFSSLNPRLSIGSTLREVLRSRAGRASLAGEGRSASGREGRSEIAQRVESGLAEVGLPLDVLHRYPRELSGGQLQRVGLARALLMRPRFIVADEPLSSLDLSVQAQILNLLAGLVESRALALLLVSHDLAVVAHVADRVSVMYSGRIVETGPTEALFASPRHPYTRALVAAAPDPRRAVRGGARPPAIEGEPPDPAGPVRGCRFAPRCPFRMPRCAEEEPDLIEQGLGCRSACWL